MKKIIMLLLTLVSYQGVAEEQDKAIHDELRQVLKTITTAINSQDYQKMLPVLSKDVRVTPVTEEFVKGPQAMLPYIASWFGPDKFMKSFSIEFKPDVLTELAPNKAWGVSYGTGLEHYVLNDGRSYDIQTRWTATVVLEEGVWKIRTMHIGTNFLDNPILDDAKAAINTMLILGSIGGLMVGLLMGFFIFRKKKR